MNDEIVDPRALLRDKKRRKRRFGMVIDGQSTKTIIAPLAQRSPLRQRKTRRGRRKR